MGNIDDLDRLIAPRVRAFERRHMSGPEREQMLNQTLGKEQEVLKGEAFVIGDRTAGVTSKSVWFENRRIHFAAIASIAVGEIEDADPVKYCVDINCTVHRSYRISVQTIPQADNFLVGLSQFMSFKLVPTMEEEMREQLHAEELAAANEANADRRQRRMEALAIRHQELVRGLIQIEAAPRVSFGVIY